MISAILRWLPVSLALHSAALAATLLLPRDTALVPLFVDLTLTEPAAPSDSPGRAPTAAPRAGADSGRVAPTPSRLPRAAVTTPPVSSQAAAAAPPAMARPMAPPPSPPVVAPEPVAPSSVAEPAVTPAESPAPPSTQTGAMSPSTAPSSGSGSSSSSSGGVADGGSGWGVSAVGRDAGGGSGSGASGVGDSVALGIAGDDGGVYAGYIAMLRRRVQEALTYPSAARRRGMSGTVHLDISVEPTGRIADVLVVRSSSHELLDRAALDSVRALRQVPFPPGVRPRAVRVRLPVVFELR